MSNEERDIVKAKGVGIPKDPNSSLKEEDNSHPQSSSIHYIGIERLVDFN